LNAQQFLQLTEREQDATIPHLTPAQGLELYRQLYAMQGMGGLGSWLSKALKKIAPIAATAVSFIPGVGTAVASAINNYAADKNVAAPAPPPPPAAPPPAPAAAGLNTNTLLLVGAGLVAVLLLSRRR
jgi:uncharacterized membrane protein YebE (DUF533 family)